MLRNFVIITHQTSIDQSSENDGCQRFRRTEDILDGIGAVFNLFLIIFGFCFEMKIKIVNKSGQYSDQPGPM